MIVLISLSGSCSRGATARTWRLGAVEVVKYMLESETLLVAI